MRLSNEQKAFYADHGYLAVENVIPEPVIDAMRDRLDQLCQEWDSEPAKRVGVVQEADLAGSATMQQTAQTVRKFYKLVHHEPLFRVHATSKLLVDMVADLIGRPICLYDDQALLKPPMVGSKKEPHQDNAYFQVEPADAVITCWCALDDATLDNGCMYYFPGAHKRGLVEHESIPGTPHLVPKGLDENEAVAVPIRAGGLIFHHALALHFSPTNKSDRWRRAFVCHYARSDARMPKQDSEYLLPL